MPKCPECKREIDTLNAFSTEVNKQEVMLNKDGKTLDWSETETVESSCTKTEWECPFCEATLFTTGGSPYPEEVVNFLKGK
jgi:hypothetical protein